jgi:hypothetical protein
MNLKTALPAVELLACLAVGPAAVPFLWPNTPTRPSVGMR